MRTQAAAVASNSPCSANGVASCQLAFHPRGSNCLSEPIVGMSAGQAMIC